MGLICWFVNHCMEASKAGSMWPVFGSRQKIAKCWGTGRKRRKTGRTESPPAVGGPCRHTGLDVCCFFFFILISCRKQ